MGWAHDEEGEEAEDEAVGDVGQAAMYAGEQGHGRLLGLVVGGRLCARASVAQMFDGASLGCRVGLGGWEGAWGRRGDGCGWRVGVV